MQSSAENDERVMTLAAAALRMPATERDEFLRVACKNAAALHCEVVEVVEWEERMGDFLRRPLIELIDLEPSPKPFQPGQVISERFVIMGEIGEGGMGVVYEAFDRKRNQRVAIKCGKPGFARLLSPELEGALKVRHPNICLVNEIHTAYSDSGDVDFLTMEFLDGETLAKRLARESKLKPDEALEIARQLCAGLSAAHKAGILHRDLKAANVILVRNDDGQVRAVITDFGLAAESWLETDLDGGTPKYMAPELWNNKKPSKASDVFALGVILYEMVAGQAPFGSTTRPLLAKDGLPNNEIARHQSSSAPNSAPPKPPSALNKDLDAHWDRAILPCLGASPAERPGADQVLAVFDRRPLWKSPLLAVGVLGLLALLAAFQQPIMKLFKPADIRLAILPLDAPPELQEMGNGVLQDVADRINHSRRSNSTVVLIPIMEVLRNNVQNAEQAQAALHATHVLELKLQAAENNIFVEESVIELVHFTRLGHFTGKYALAKATDLPRSLTGVVSDALHLHSSNTDTISSGGTAAYDRGLFYLHGEGANLDAAMAQFHEAAGLDPHSPLPLTKLAEAQIGKFEATKDSQWLKQAHYSLSGAEAINPDSVSVHLANGMLDRNEGSYPQALDHYRRVQELEPRNVEAWVGVAEIYDLENMPEKAIATYKTAIELDPAYYRTYERLGAFYYYRGEYKKAAEQFRNEIQRAPRVLDGYSNLGGLLTVLGNFNEAVDVLQTSLNIAETPRTLNNLGVALAFLRRDSEAITYYRRALQLQPGNYFYWINLGDAQRRQGNITDAAIAYSKGEEFAYAELKANPTRSQTRCFVGYFKARLGDRKGAEDELAQALHFATADSQILRCAALTYQAMDLTEQAFAILSSAPRQVLSELNAHPDFGELRNDSRFQQLLRNK